MKQKSTFFSFIGIILTAVFLMINSISDAQILKVDKGTLDADSSGYFMGSVDVSFNMNNKSATVEEDVVFKGLDGNADLVYMSKKHAYILINSINYFKSTGGPLISTGYAHFRANFLRKKTLSYELFTQIQYDDGRNMPYRFLQGGGIKIHLIKTDKATMYMGIGIMHEEEHWKSVSMENQIIEKDLWKTSDYISAKIKFNDNIDFNLITYYQGGYDNESDVFRNRISGDAVFTIKVSNRLDFLTSFTAQYEDKPIIPINKFVYSLTNGLKFSF